MDASRYGSKLKKLSDAEKGYIAGIIDGESHLYVTAFQSNTHYSRIRTRITDKCITDYLRKTTGVGVVSVHQPKQLKKDGSQKKLVYEWTVFKRVDVRELLKAVMQYLVLKKQHAKYILELESLKDQGIATGYDCERIKHLISRRMSH